MLLQVAINYWRIRTTDSTKALSIWWTQKIITLSFIWIQIFKIWKTQNVTSYLFCLICLIHSDYNAHYSQSKNLVLRTLTEKSLILSRKNLSQICWWLKLMLELRLRLCRFMDFLIDKVYRCRIYVPSRESLIIRYEPLLSQNVAEIQEWSELRGWSDNYSTWPYRLLALVFHKSKF